MGKKRSPIQWFGGKGSMTAKLLPKIPDHKIYVEPFGGGASMLFAKEPSPVEVYNDLNSGLINFFRVLRDEDRAAKLHWKVSQTPKSREEYHHCLETWAQCEDSIERAYRWFVVVRNSFSGLFGRGWQFSKNTSTRGMAQSVSAWLSSHKILGDAHDRLMRVQIEQVDFRRIFKSYDTPETLFYLDPPYVHDTRRSGKYDHEMSDEDHADLVEILLAIQGKALLSGYRNELYKPLERAGWKRLDIPVVCCVSPARGEGSREKSDGRVESLWISPNARQRRKGKRSGGKKFKLSRPVHVYRARETCLV